MKNVLRKSKRFFNKNGATILTCLGGIGVVATSVMAVKATPKAISLLEEAKKEKGDELTKFETIKTAGPVYIPSVVTGAATLSCIFGANMLNKRHQASLASAYALLDSSYKKYKEKAIELYGKNADKEIQEEIVRDNFTHEVTEQNADTHLYYDMYSGRYFNATNAQVLKAEYEINKMLSEDCYVYLNEFYELLGLEKVDYGDFIGWSSSQMFEMYWSSWINFRHEKVEMEDGLECYIITMTEPMADIDEH